MFSFNSGHLAELVSKGALSFILKILAAGMTFILTIIISRYLGAEGAGYYFLAITIVTVLASVSQMGFSPVITRFVSAYSSNGDWQSINGLYTFVATHIFSVMLGVSTLVFIFAPYISQVIFQKNLLEEPLRFTAFGVVLLGVSLLKGQFFQGLKEVGKLQFCQNLGLPSFLVVLLLPSHLILGSLVEGQVALLYLLASILVVIIANWWWWQKPQVSWKLNYDSTEIWRAAMPMWGVGVLGVLMNWGASLLLGVWGASADIAVFHNAFRTAGLTMLVLVAINSIAAPKFSVLYHQGDRDGLKHLAIWSTRLMVLVCIPVVGCLLAFPEWVMGLFGSEFIVGAPALMVLAIGQFVNVVTGSVGLLLSMTGHEKFALRASGLAAVCMLVLCFVLIPQYGVMGAAIAQAVSLSAHMLLNSWFVKKILGFTPMNIFARV